MPHYPCYNYNIAQRLIPPQGFVIHIISSTPAFFFMCLQLKMAESREWIGWSPFEYKKKWMTLRVVSVVVSDPIRSDDKSIVIGYGTWMNPSVPSESMALIASRVESKQWYKKKQEAALHTPYVCTGISGWGPTVRPTARGRGASQSYQ